MGEKKVDHNSRRGGALPLTPHTKELSPVKDHRYRRRRRKRRRRVGGEQRRKRTVTATVMTKTVCERGETTEGRKENSKGKERCRSSWGGEGVNYRRAQINSSAVCEGCRLLIGQFRLPIEILDLIQF